MINNKQTDKFKKAEQEGRKITKKKLFKLLGVTNWQWTTRKYDCIDALIMTRDYNAILEIKYRPNHAEPETEECLIQEDKFLKVIKQSLNLGKITPLYLHIYYNPLNQKHTFYLYDLRECFDIPTELRECKWQTMGNDQYVMKKVMMLPLTMAKKFVV